MLEDKKDARAQSQEIPLKGIRFRVWLRTAGLCQPLLLTFAIILVEVHLSDSHLSPSHLIVKCCRFFFQHTLFSLFPLHLSTLLSCLPHISLNRISSIPFYFSLRLVSFNSFRFPLTCNLFHTPTQKNVCSLNLSHLTRSFNFSSEVVSSLHLSLSHSGLLDFSPLLIQPLHFDFLTFFLWPSNSFSSLSENLSVLLSLPLATKPLPSHLFFSSSALFSFFCSQRE